MLRHSLDVSKLTNGNGHTHGYHNGSCNGITKLDVKPVTRKSQVAGELLDLRSELTNGRDDSSSMPMPPLHLSSLRGSSARPRSSSVQPLPPPKAGAHDLLPARK